MVRLLLTTIVVLFLEQVAEAQFTTENEYRKQVKKYPEISIYESPAGDEVKSELGTVYREIGGIELTLDIFWREDVVEKTGNTMLVMVHGGGWASGSKEMDHAIARSLAARGIVTVTVDYRKSDVARYPAGVQDVKCAIRYLKGRAEDFGIGEGRFCISGTSAGGQMASLIGASNSDDDEFATREYGNYSSRVDKVIDIDGVLCFIHPDSAEGQGKPGKPSAADLWFGKSLTEMPELWDSASALYRVNRGSADFVFINSGQPRFSAGQAHMMRRLQAYGKKAREMKFDNTPHTFWLFNPWAPQLVDRLEEILKEK